MNDQEPLRPIQKDEISVFFGFHFLCGLENFMWQELEKDRERIPDPLDWFFTNLNRAEQCDYIYKHVKNDRQMGNTRWVFRKIDELAEEAILERLMERLTSQFKDRQLQEFKTLRVKIS